MTNRNSNEQKLRSRRQPRRLAKITLLGGSVLALLWLVGPRVTVDSTLREVELPEISGLENYLEQQEKPYQDRLIPGAEKIIRFHHEDKRKTDFAVVYLHGFSASRQDSRPIPRTVADRLQANLYYARLTDHGLREEVFADVTANDWLNDAHEAVEIGKKLGDQVVVMGHSTGATLGLWRANLDPTGVAAVVLLSPNFGLANPQAQLATYPWGKVLGRLLQGRYNEFEPKSPEHAMFWTERYLLDAAVEVIALADYCSGQSYDEFAIPTLLIYSEKDTLISLPKLRAQWTKISDDSKWLYALPDSPGHGLAGDIRSPETTAPLLQKLFEFLSANFPGALGPLEPVGSPTQEGLSL